MTDTFKRGDSLDWWGQVSPVPDGGFAGWTIAAKLRGQDGAEIAALVPEWLDAAQGLFRLTAGATGAWPLGLAVFDVSMTTPEGQVATSETAQLRIVERISR